MRLESRRDGMEVKERVLEASQSRASVPWSLLPAREFSLSPLGSADFGTPGSCGRTGETWPGSISWCCPPTPPFSPKTTPMPTPAPDP